MSAIFSFQIRISDDLKNLAQQFPKYAQPVLNRTARETATLASRELEKQNNVTAGYIRKRIVVIPSTMGKLVAILRFSERSFSPVWFLKDKSPTTHQELVKLEIKKGSTKVISGGFFVNKGIKTGRLFIRKQTLPDDRTKLARLPYIKAKEIFNLPALNPILQAFAERRLETELPRVIKALYKAGK